MNKRIGTFVLCIGPGEFIAISAIILAGLAIRIYNVGDLGLWLNEDYLAISVRSVLDNGYPIFPSGIVYPRAIPQTYVATLSSIILGYSEYSLRFPSVIFSTLTIIFTYILGRQTVGHRVGLISALLIAFFPWDVASAQSARMYAFFSFSVIASLVFIHAAEVNGIKVLRSLAVPAIVLVGFLHQLAIAVVLMLIVLMPYFHSRTARIRPLLGYILLLLVAVFVSKYIGDTQYDRWDSLVAATANSDPKFAIAHLGEVMAPLLYQGLEKLSFSAISFSFVLIASSTVLIIQCFRKRRVWFEFAVLAGIAFFLALQQLVIGGLFWLMMVFLDRVRAIDKDQRILLVFGAGLLSVGVLGWYIIGLSQIDLFDFASQKQLVEHLFALQPMYLRIYLATHPYHTVVYGFVLLWSIFSLRSLNGIVVVIGIFLVPIIAMGFHPDALGRLYERYVYVFSPYFLIVVSFGLVSVVRGLADSWSEKRYWVGAFYGFLLCVLGVGVIGREMRESVVLVDSGYGLNAELQNNWTGRPYFRPDFKTTGTYIEDHYQDGDTIIATDILATYVYLNDVEYQLSIAGKNDGKGWLGRGYFSTYEELVELIDSKSKSEDRIWLIIAGLHALYPGDWSDKADFRRTMSLVDSRFGRAEYVGKDGFTAVYLYRPVNQ